MLDGGGVCVVSGTVNGSFLPPIRSHTMLTWIKQQIKRWLVFSSQRPSVSCWEVFQATFLKFLHTADDITLQKNRNETNLEGKGGMQICVWKPISCIHYWKDVWDFGETSTVNTRKHEPNCECSSCFFHTHFYLKCLCFKT